MNTMRHSLYKGLAAFALLSEGAWAQTYDNQTTNGPFTTGTQTFSNGAIFAADSANAASGGSTQNFNDTSVLNASAANAISGGKQNFHGNSQMNVSATSGAVYGTQTFYDDSVLNVTAAQGLANVGGNSTVTGQRTFYDRSTMNITGNGSVVGGSLDFEAGSTLNAATSGALPSTAYIQPGATLNASAANAIGAGSYINVTNGTLNAKASSSIADGRVLIFNGGTLNASVENAITGGRQELRDQVAGTTPSSVMNATAAHAIAGGTQVFTSTSILNASVADAISGGQQAFYDTSTLNVSAANAISGGQQYLTNGHAISNDPPNTHFLISAANAITGGVQYIYDTSVVNVAVAGAINGGIQYLLGNSTLAIGANDALTNQSSIYFDTQEGGNGGTLALNGHDTAVGNIYSKNDGDGVIQNGAATSATLTVDTNSLGNTEFRGTLQDGGAGTLALTKTGADALYLSSATHTYTGATTVQGGTLYANVADALSPASAVTVEANGTLALLDNAQTIPGMNLAGGTVSLSSPAGAPSTTLTVTGDWAGKGGTVLLDVALADAGNAADQLVIGGNATGTTALKLAIAGSGVATTGDGIPVARVTGTSAANAFTLAGSPVVVGEYEYRLAQVGQDWYLQAQKRQGGGGGSGSSGSSGNAGRGDARLSAVPLDAHWMLALTGLLLAAAGAGTLRTARRH